MPKKLKIFCLKIHKCAGFFNNFQQIILVEGNFYLNKIKVFSEHTTNILFSLSKDSSLFYIYLLFNRSEAVF